MGLKQFKLRVETVEVSDGDSFTVRGLDTIDIMALAHDHREALSGLFAKFDNGGMDAIMEDSSTLIASAFATVPKVLMQIIALGADEEDVDLVRLLPIVAQIEAIEKIGKLTFASNSPKKILETIMRVMKGATGAINRS